jgi:GntR family transcriptional regulator
MLIAVDANDPRPLYVQIVDEVRRALVLGRLAVDESLPSVRALAADLRINPNTVSQAYRELERDGVVEVRRGQGTYIVKASVNGTQRRALARAVVDRAMRDAQRCGLSVEELIEAIRAASSTHSK